MRFRRKPKIVDAIQWTGSDKSTGEVLRWSKGAVYWTPERKAIDNSIISDEALVMNTKYGVARAKPGEWIIRGSCGLCYPSSKKDFEANYEPYKPR